MSAESDKSILIRAYDCKIRSKVNIQEFLDIVNEQIRLKKISEKGLFILYLCQILFKAYLAQGLKIRNFIVQFDKKEVKKRQKREGGEPRKRRTARNQNKRGNEKTLEQLSNQSLSNPSNVQRPRINVENRPDQSGNQIQTSRQKEQDSNHGSKDSSKNPLKVQLNKIVEQLRGQQETFVTDVDFAPNTQFQDNSQTTSSQNSGQISNLSEKIKIFTSLKQNQRRTTTTRRKTTNNNSSRQTRTKKKKYDIIDQSILLQQTRASQNDITFVYTQVSRFNSQQMNDLDLQNNFYLNMGTNEVDLITQIFQKQKLEIVKGIVQIGMVPQHQNENNYYDMSQNNDDIQFPDYTMSQPISAPFYQPDFFKQSLQIKDSQFNFQDLINHSTKDKSTLFYQLLWREQNDEVSLFQVQPEKFSSIKIKHK